jgi:hypothetical protein
MKDVDGRDEAFYSHDKGTRTSVTEHDKLTKTNQKERQD